MLHQISDRGAPVRLRRAHRLNSAVTKGEYNSTCIIYITMHILYIYIYMNDMNDIILYYIIFYYSKGAPVRPRRAHQHYHIIAIYLIAFLRKTAHKGTRTPARAHAYAHGHESKDETCGIGRADGGGRGSGG